jgi:hypothetical protein
MTVVDVVHATTALHGGPAVAAGVLAVLSWLAMVAAAVRLVLTGRRRRWWLALGAVPVLNLVVLVALDDAWLRAAPQGAEPGPPGVFATYSR